MWKFVALVAKNLGRNKIRTALTGLAVIVLVAIFAVVATVTRTVAQIVQNEASQTKLIVTERWVAPSRIPLRYVPDVVSVAGIEDWTTWNIYTGFYDDSMLRDRAGLGIATRIDNLTSMMPELAQLDPQVLETLKKTKTGALVAADVVERMNWKVGQRFTFVSTNLPGRNLEFEIVGVLPRRSMPRSFLFRLDYFQEATGEDTYVNMIWLRVADTAAARHVAATIQRMFEQRQPQLKVETESAGAARFVGRSQAVLSIINVVVAILFADMVVILSNSISISTRERRVEMAVLKVLGFEPRHIMLMVIGEAVLVGGISGLLGAASAWGFSELTARGIIPATAATGFLTLFPIQPDAIAWGLFIGMAVGLMGSFVPALNARSVKVADVFARIA